MSKRVTFKGPQIIELFEGLNQDLNVARAYTTAERESQVKEKEASLRANGQVSPVQLQEDGKGGYIPIAGLTRIAAASRIVQGYEVEGQTEEGEAAPVVTLADTSFTLDAIVFAADELTPLERSLRCIIDNQVEAPSDIDIGRSIQSLVKEHGLTLTACGEKLGINDPNKPGHCVRLLQLPEWFQNGIHAGIIASSVGLFYLKIKGEPKKAVGDEVKAKLAKGKGITLNQAKVIATEAEEAAGVESDEEDGEEDEGGSKAPSSPPKLPIKEVVQGFETLVADLKSATAALQSDAAIARGESAVKLFQSFNRWLHSGVSYDTLYKNVCKAFDVE